MQAKSRRSRSDLSLESQSIRLDSICPAERHGDTYKAYTNWRCRCPAARRAWKRYKLDKRRGTFAYERIDATGTRRRIHALMAIGWTQHDIATQLGDVQHGAVHQLARATKVRQSNADRIAKLYDQLSLRIPPDTDSAKRVRAYAKRQGWAPPLAWDDIDDPTAEPQMPEDTGAVDEVAIERRLAGEKVELNQAERAVIRELDQKRIAAARAQRERRRALAEAAYAKGLSVMDAAAASGMDRTSVLKIYKRLRSEAA